MSDDERSGSSSDSEDLGTTGLIATRQKRATAGNLYATLRANLDDEELQKELLAEDAEEDAGDYEGSDKDDDDEVLESSSDDEDAGPPQEGQAEELEGEKALKKQERVEAKKKRKAHEARLKLPAWRQKKKVKLADDVKTEDGNTSERPKKKSERSNWLPTGADAPLRQSGRSLAVANREVIHANLKQSAQRSEKQRRVMKDAAERERSKRRMEGMTQEERLKKCERIERETAREFGRWEREEAERQRLREEAIAAKRRRGVSGPVVKWWSGSVLWEGERIKVRRMSHGSKKLEEIKDDKKVLGDGNHETNDVGDSTGIKEQASPTATDAAMRDENQATSESHLTTAATQTPTQPQPSQSSSDTQASAIQAPVPWLQGIQEYAAQPEPVHSQPPSQSNYIPSAPLINGTAPGIPQQQPYPTYPPPPPQFYHGWPPGSNQFAIQPAPPPSPPAPLIREQAQRSLIILEQFSALEAASAKRIPKYKQLQETALDATPVSNIMLPLSHPTFNAEESKYVLSRPRKRGNEVPLPPPPPKQRCAVTSWPAKFRDPKTGLAYADLHQYKVIQRVLAGGCQWSSLLGAWVGPSYGLMGRPARGVPDAFAKKEVGATVVKIES